MYGRFCIKFPQSRIKGERDFSYFPMVSPESYRKPSEHVQNGPFEMGRGLQSFYFLTRVIPQLSTQMFQMFMNRQH